MAQIAIIATDSWYIWNFRSATIRRLLAEGHAVTVYCGNSAYFRKLEALGVRPIHVPLDGRKIRPLRELKALVLLALALKRDRSSVILSFNPKGNLFAGLIRRLFKFGWIANVSGLGILGEAKGFSARAVAALFRFAFHKVDHAFFQNDVDLGNWTENRIVAGDRASRQYGTGVDLDEFAKVEPPEGPVQVVCIARLLEKKGIGEYIALAESVRKRIPEVQFLLAGTVVPVDQGGFPADRIALAEAEGYIRFLGMLEDVRPVLASRSIGCLLTRYREGIPRSMIEFLATGRPILVSNFDGAEDLVSGAENGRIVDLNSATWMDSASKFIVEAATSPAHYAALGRESRRLAEQRFDGDVGISEYLDLIDDLTKR